MIDRKLESKKNIKNEKNKKKRDVKNMKYKINKTDLRYKKEIIKYEKNKKVI